MINFKVLERLLELLNSSNAGSIEVRKNLWSTTIRVSKDTTFGNSGPGLSAPPASSAPSHTGAGGAEGAEGAGGAVEAAPAYLVEIKSPMVGTFYAQPEPGADPYVRVGSRISIGQTLCVIEAMKIMNPIDAEIAGVIKEISVQDAQPVEYGQVLFRVDSNG